MSWKYLPTPKVSQPCSRRCCGSVVQRGRRIPPPSPLMQTDSTPSLSHGAREPPCTALKSVHVLLRSCQPAQPGEAKQSVQHCALPPEAPGLRPMNEMPLRWRVPGSGVPLSSTPGAVLGHSACRMWLRKFHACVVLGRRPVVKDMRLGEQTVSWL